MRLSKQTEYGLRAVVQLARLSPRTFVQSRDLAQQEGLPTKFLEAILLTLRRGGVLESKVGREGGYRLSRSPQEISELSAGELAVHLLNEQLTQATDQVLDKLSLEQLLERVNRTGNLQQQMYYI